jgi:thiamine phosphate synthase YjbQ (UPF0047 family)
MYDFENFLERIAPSSRQYYHDDIEERVDCPENEPLNGHSHCKALFIPPGLYVPVEDYRMELGKWQRLFHVDFDYVNRQRRIKVKVREDV